MQSTLTVLLGTALTVALLHTLIGVDHYLPFIVIGRARRWTLRRTLVVTALCGAGHVLSSVALGMAGIALGNAASHLRLIEVRRGALAAWLLIGFGLAYACWGYYRRRRGHVHAHLHQHGDGTAHLHAHAHAGVHLHPHGDVERSVTVWALFVVFVFGPCEPLIPLLMVPGMHHDWGGVALLAMTFGIVTIATMLLVTAVGHLGLRLPVFARLEEHAHVLAGLAIAASGLAIQVLGV